MKYVAQDPVRNH